MKTLKLQGVRISELASVVDSIPPKELATLKDIRLASGVVKDLRASIQTLADAVYDFNKKQAELVKPYQERFLIEGKDLPEAEKDAFTKKLDAEFQMEIKTKIGEEQQKLEELGKGEVNIELSDEKLDFLKSVFEKNCKDKYLNKEVLVEVADALGL